LPEGATTLPEGATLSFYLMEAVEAVAWASRLRSLAAAVRLAAALRDSSSMIARRFAGPTFAQRIRASSAAKLDAMLFAIPPKVRPPSGQCQDERKTALDSTERTVYVVGMQKKRQNDLDQLPADANAAAATLAVVCGAIDMPRNLPVAVAFLAIGRIVAAEWGKSVSLTRAGSEKLAYNFSDVLLGMLAEARAQQELSAVAAATRHEVPSWGRTHFGWART
jgi:hypothetical protein